MPVFNTTPLPVEVYVAPTGTGVYATCTIKNISPSQTLFVGLSAVTPNTGLPLQPNVQIDMPAAASSLYACSNWAAGAGLATAAASATTVGTTSWTVGAVTNIPPGTYLLIGTGSGQEALKVATTASTTTITTSTGALFDHAASEVMYAVTTTPGVLQVSRGTSLPPVAQAAFPGRG